MKLKITTYEIQIELFPETIATIHAIDRGPQR